MDHLFTKIASKAAHLMGQPAAFIAAAVSIMLWAASGPMLHYSDTWQLIVNTATTVLTFLAVFLIQNSQNRDGAAMQAKLDEILRVLTSARDEFVGIEHLTAVEIETIRDALETDIAGGKEAGDKAAASAVDRLLKRV